MDRFFLRVGAALLISGLGGVAATAAPPGYMDVGLRVPHSDLDLTKVSDRKILRKRIAAEVSRMCTHPDPTALQARAIKRDCVARSRSTVDQQVELAVDRARGATRDALASRE